MVIELRPSLAVSSQHLDCVARLQVRKVPANTACGRNMGQSAESWGCLKGVYSHFSNV